MKRLAFVAEFPQDLGVVERHPADIGGTVKLLGQLEGPFEMLAGLFGIARRCGADASTTKTVFIA